jgi:DNA-binding response OmpR family regulator
MKRILIVDDDSEILESLATLLEEKYEVSVASDGYGALDRMKERPCDLILLDFRMPGLDGSGLVHALQASGNKTQVLLMSASTNVAEHAKGLRVADYLAKPFHIDELEAKIERIIGMGPAPDGEGKANADATGMPKLLELAKKHIVLFVDDEPEILSSVKVLLADEPYELLTTDKPAQALRWVQEKVVSLIICDQVMPDEIGTEFLEQVRARSSDTQCAILTAYPEGAKLLRALNQGVFLIPKPFEVEELKRTIRKLLQDREKAVAAKR